MTTLAGFQVSMDDARGVRGRQRITDVDGVPEREPHRDRTRGHHVSKRAASHEFHDDGRVPIALDQVVNSGDVWVVERRQRLCLTLEARAKLRVIEQVGQEEFDRDVAPEPRVARAIHVAHPTGTKRGNDFVGSEPLSREHDVGGLYAAFSALRRAD